jgi:hypothetical protein
MGNMRNACRILDGKPEGKRLLVRLKCNWEDKIKIDLKEIGCERVDLILVAQMASFLNS